MTEEPRRPAGDEDMEADGLPGSEEIEITGYEAVDADAPPPSATGTEAGGTDEDVHTASSAPADGDAAEKIGALENDLLRIRAEFENFRKRQSREKDDFLRHASAGLMERLLPALDNFKRAMTAPADDQAMAAFRSGIGMIFSQLLEILEKEGLEAIATEGQPFDPNLHEAVAREETDEVEPNTITLELEPGYRFRNRLLKPARVRVAVAPQADS